MLFMWFRSPVTNFIRVVWRRSRFKIIAIAIILVMGLLLFNFIYSAPNYLAMNVIKPELRLNAPVEFQANIVYSLNTSDTNPSIPTTHHLSLKPTTDPKLKLL